MGGTGDDYVLANAILAAAQWAAAMATAAFFALTLGREWAMLLAAALLSGAGYASASFAAGIPSGWLFILTPWAINIFLKRRLVPAAAAASAAIYVHIAGLAMVPLGILAAAALTGRWRDLIRVGLAIAIITAPCSIHCLRYTQWFSGVRNCSPLLFDPLLDALGTIGLAAAMGRPRDNAFLLAWAIAPLAWLFQDPGRFVVQSGLTASVLAAVWLSASLVQMRETNRAAVAALVIALATLTPFGPPGARGRGGVDGRGALSAGARLAGGQSACRHDRAPRPCGKAGRRLSACALSRDRGLCADRVREGALGRGATAGRSSGRFGDGKQSLCAAASSPRSCAGSDGAARMAPHVGRRGRFDGGNSRHDCPA
jgi:hypothetical protein